MKSTLKIIIITLFFTPLFAIAQKDTLTKKLDSLNIKADSAGRQKNNISPSAYNQTTKFTVKTYFLLLGSDLKQEFTKPFHMTGKNWGNLGKFALVSTPFFFLDEPIQRAALKSQNSNAGLNHVSKFITNFGGTYEAYTLAAFGAYGLIFKSEKMKTTTLLATQAYLTGGALESVMKYVTGRTRPSAYSANAEAEPKFLGPFSKTSTTTTGKKRYSSFPSGHTTVAFAAATVFAKEYSNKPLIPIIAYSAASLIGVSRVVQNAHWTTDVIFGAAIGYLAGKNVVNNYHRYMKIKQSSKPVKNMQSITFSLEPFYGKLLPSINYTF